MTFRGSRRKAWGTFARWCAISFLVCLPLAAEAKKHRPLVFLLFGSIWVGCSVAGAVQARRIAHDRVEVDRRELRRPLGGDGTMLAHAVGEIAVAYVREPCFRRRELVLATDRARHVIPDHFDAPVESIAEAMGLTIADPPDVAARYRGDADVVLEEKPAKKCFDFFGMHRVRRLFLVSPEWVIVNDDIVPARLVRDVGHASLFEPGVVFALRDGSELRGGRPVQERRVRAILGFGKPDFVYGDEAQATLGITAAQFAAIGLPADPESVGSPRYRRADVEALRARLR